MSGGHFDYVGQRIKDGLEDIAEDERMLKRFPRLAKSLSELGGVLYEIEHDIDWDLSCDTPIEDDRIFEARARDKLMNAILGTPTGLRT